MLSEQVRRLGETVGRAVARQAGEETFRLVEELRRLCKQGGPAKRDEAARVLAGLPLAQLEWVLRAYTVFFHLVNQAEKREIVRVNRERSRRGVRPESVEAAVALWKERGVPADEALDRIARLDLVPTLTAHPTEARRRSVLDKQRRVARLLGELERPDALPEEVDAAREEIARQVSLLLATEEVPHARPTVLDEVRQGLHFLRTSIWETVPRVHDDVRRAMRAHYGVEVDPPAFLRYRTWIGGDRDGNPSVTPDITRETADLQRRTALRLLRRELRVLWRDLSVAARHVGGGGGPEPLRATVAAMRARLRDASYRSDDLVRDLEAVRDALADSGLGDVARGGRLARVLALARTFGFHLAAIDVRQHSRVHEGAVAALLRAGSVTADYAALREDDRIAILTRELESPRPLLPRAAELPADARDAIETLAVVRDLQRRDPPAVGAYVVSMTHAVSDILEACVLCKEAGVAPLDVVPLFETVEDLAGAEERLRVLFANPAYRRHLDARGGFQEVMLGYSDSNKDGGYWMANWALHRAQERVAAACRDAGLDFRLFHGRGGTVGRGGGRAGAAVLAQPHAVHNGRMRFTEQGEVISFRYGLPEIAHRHVEQIVHAMLLAPDARDAPADAGLMDRAAARARATYRELIDAPGFFEWYARITPIELISRLPIASRPVSRGSAGEVDFEGLRAIPWVFSWTQTRHLVPGWFGTGAALEGEDPAALARLYRDWPFFHAVVDGARREMARARLEIAERYAARGGGGFHARIAADFERARRAIRAMTGEELLGNEPVIERSIELRNPYTDVLNLVQLELLRRDDGEAVQRARLASVNGIAAAMQSTG